MKFAVVAVGYNRPDSMELLLRTILDAEYGGNEVDLIISIDRGARQNEIVQAAEEVEWTHGQKIIRAFEQRQGLRKHILQCGDLTESYDAVVVLEDDLIVSKYYFSYVQQMTDIWDKDDRIGGIALYKHAIHPGTHRMFEAVQNGADVFLMQYAMSWGQCWTKRMWRQFRAWYEKNEKSDLAAGDLLPQYITNWNEQSWLKYFMRYIVETNKYFVYPYVALSSNASDAGEHCSIPNNDFQIPLLQGEIRYRVPAFEKMVCYDIYFERIGINQQLKDIFGKPVALDLYGSRHAPKAENGYYISSRQLPYKVVRELQLWSRPIEMNCLVPRDGKGIFVYDLSIADAIPDNRTDVITRYDVRCIPWRRLLSLSVSMIKERGIFKIKKIFSKTMKK